MRDAFNALLKQAKAAPNMGVAKDDGTAAPKGQPTVLLFSARKDPPPLLKWLSVEFDGRATFAKASAAQLGALAHEGTPLGAELVAEEDLPALVVLPVDGACTAQRRCCC